MQNQQELDFNKEAIKRNNTLRIVNIKAWPFTMSSNTSNSYKII